MSKLSGNDTATVKMYREEMNSNDHYHKSLAMFLGLIAVGFYVAVEVTNLLVFQKYVVLFSISALGAILRLDTMVHRLGAFNKEFGDPWENWKENLKHDKEHLVLSDIVLLVPLAYCLVSNYFNIFLVQGLTVYTMWYILTIVLILILIACWAVTPTRVRVKKNPSNSF